PRPGQASHASQGPREHPSQRPRKLSLIAVPDADSNIEQTVVMKFGGTSVADADRVKRAAERIVAAKEAGSRVVAVLSARGKTTDGPVSLGYEVSPRPAPCDMGRLRCARAPIS